MQDAVIVISKSDVEPVSLAFARKHLKLTPEGSPLSHADDELVTHLITAAREQVEEYTGLTIVPSVLEQRLDAFPVGPFILFGAPVREIESVSYIDTANVEQTVASSIYSLNAVPLFPTVSVAQGMAWPTGLATAQAGSVRIRYRAGFTDNESPNNWPTPARLRHAILLMLTHWYENRSAVEFAQSYEVPFSAIALMNLMRARRGVA